MSKKMSDKAREAKKARDAKYRAAKKAAKLAQAEKAKAKTPASNTDKIERLAMVNFVLTTALMPAALTFRQVCDDKRVPDDTKAVVRASLGVIMKALEIAESGKEVR